MESIQSTGYSGLERRGRLTGAVVAALRDLRGQLSVLNHQVGARLDLRDVDLDCLDLIARSGPLSPSVLARRVGLHPATVTGILDRLERGGWIARDRDPTDRRAVVVRATRGRISEVFGLYSGMISSMDEICATYDEAQLELITDFLRRAAEAGRDAADKVATD
jgi:DNA-binding MarR family transcriptional regulator